MTSETQIAFGAAGLKVVARAELLEVFVSVDTTNEDQLLLLHDLPDAVDADLAAFLLQYGGDFLGPVALMAAVEYSLHVFHGLFFVQYEPWWCVVS